MCINLIDSLHVMNIYDNSYSIENQSIAKRLKFESLKKLNELSDKHKHEQNSLCEELKLNNKIPHHIRLSTQTESERIYIGCIVDLINNFEHHEYNMWLMNDNTNENKYIDQILLLRSHGSKHYLKYIKFSTISFLS